MKKPPTNHWLAIPRNAPPAFRTALKLYCFPYAGGGAHSYDGWQARLDPSVQMATVELPGRGRNLACTPHTSIAAIVEELAAVVLADADRMPFAFYGHSMGALIAFELSRLLHARQVRMPVKLLVSGCNAPSVERTSALHKMGDDELIMRLRQYNGTPPEVLAHRELMELMLPTIRADFAVVETYRYRAGPELPIPIAALAGTEDGYLSTFKGWAKESRACKIHWFEGDHFFIKKERDAVLKTINGELAPYVLAQSMTA